MPKELFEITMFNAGTICNPSQTDIPSDAASNSLNIDPTAEDGKVKGIKANTKIEDNVGHETNVLLNNITDSSKHDVISYKNSDNKIYKAEDIYSGSSTESEINGSGLGLLTNATDSDIAMQAVEGAVYLGQGTADDANPQWIGRLDHGQWGSAASNTLVMEEDNIEPPNMINETTTACTDGTYIYTANTGLHGNYHAWDSRNSHKHASGEITKVRISDGKVIARSNVVLGYTNALCLSSDNYWIWVLTSEKYGIADTDTDVTTNTHYIYKLDKTDLKLASTHTTNLDSLVRASRGGVAGNGMDWEDTTASSGNWEDEDSYWEGAGKSSYQGVFSDIMELNDDDGVPYLWVCTSAAAIFNATNVEDSAITFTDRTPMGLGYYWKTSEFTEQYMPAGGMDNQTGGWYNHGLEGWNFPECYNASLLQLTGSDNFIGLYFRNAQREKMWLDIGGSNIAAENKAFIVVVPKGSTANAMITGSANEARIYQMNETAQAGTREIANVMYKCPIDLKKSAYAYIKTWGTTNMEWNIREFDNPAYNSTNGSTTVTTAEVEGNDTSQVPIRISDTLIVGMVTDTYVSMGDGVSSDAATRNKWRRMSKWTDSGGWSHSSFGPNFYLSQRIGRVTTAKYKGIVTQLEDDSGFHTANYGYSYRFSFVYDGFQESPLGAAMMIWSNGKKVRIPFLFHTDNFPARVTAVRVYRASSISASDRTIGGFHHFCGEVNITDQTVEKVYKESYYNGTVSYTVHSDTGANMIESANLANNSTFNSNNGDWAVSGSNVTIATYSGSAGATGGGLTISPDSEVTTPEGAQLTLAYVTDVTAGNAYRITVDIKGASDGLDDFRIGFAGTTSDPFRVTTAYATYYADLVADNNTGALIITKTNSGTNDWFIDNVYIQHIEGVSEGEQVEPEGSRLQEFVDHGATGATYETFSGLFEAMTDSNVQYGLSTEINSSLFIGKCKHHSQDNASNLIYKSLPYKPSLINWAVDFLKLPAVPTALTSYNGRLYAFTESTTYRIEPNTFFIEDTFEGTGCLSQDSVHISDFGMVYCDHTNIYHNTGGIPVPIADSILTSDDLIGYQDLLNTSSYVPKVGFDARTKCFVIFVTTTKAWAYNVVRKTWNLWEYDSSNKAKGLMSGKKGEILVALNDGHLYDMFSNATRKQWTWTSKRLAMQHKTQVKKWYELVVSYTGSAPAATSIFWDNSTVTTGISSGASETGIVRWNLGNTDNAAKKRLLKVYLQSHSDGTTELDSLGFTFRRFAKLIDQGVGG